MQQNGQDELSEEEVLWVKEMSRWWESSDWHAQEARIGKTIRVWVVRGYGEECTEPECQNRLNGLVKNLSRFGLEVSKATSERKTGGPITLHIPSKTYPDDITRAFLGFMTALAKMVNDEMAIDIQMPGGPPTRIIGTPHG